MLWETFTQKMWVALVEVSPGVMIKRFQGPLQVLLIGHSWTAKVTNFWGSK